MMNTKIVCRLLDAGNRLLGWTEHYAAVRGDGCLRADGPVVIPVDVSGVPVTVSLHWADVNVETRAPLKEYAGSVDARVGDHVHCYRHDDIMITLGPVPVGLHQVTVGRPVAIGVPVGQMGARG